jgi:hypothetical protein
MQQLTPLPHSSIFYPTLAFVVYDFKNASGDADEERGAADAEETENLLGE